jgi:hypothetical protein
VDTQIVGLKSSAVALSLTKSLVALFQVAVEAHQEEAANPSLVALSLTMSPVALFQVVVAAHQEEVVVDPSLVALNLTAMRYPAK